MKEKRKEQEIRSREGKRKGQEREEGQLFPFIEDWLPGCCQVTVGRGIPGCSQVTVGVESSQNNQGLGAWPYATDGHRVMSNPEGPVPYLPPSSAGPWLPGAPVAEARISDRPQLLI